MANLERFRISWEARENEVNQGLKTLYQDVELADVSLFCEGHLIRCHKLVLTLCSSYFNNVFRMASTDRGNALVVMHSTPLKDLQNLIQFMYTGEVEILDSELVGFLQLSQSLGVTGLTQIFQEVYGSKNVDVKAPEASHVTIPNATSTFMAQQPVDIGTNPPVQMLSSTNTFETFAGSTQRTVHVEIDPTAVYDVEDVDQSRGQAMDECSLDNDMNSQSQSSSSTSFSTAPTPLQLLKTEYDEADPLPLDNEQFEVEEVDVIDYESPKDNDSEYVPPTSGRANKSRRGRKIYILINRVGRCDLLPTNTACSQCSVVSLSAPLAQRSSRARSGNSSRRPGPSGSEYNGPKVITKCNACHLSIVGRPALHMAQYHHNEDRGVSYVCGFCGQTFKQLLICEAHYKFMHDKSQNKYTCSKCPMGFNNQATYRQHIRAHPDFDKPPKKTY